MLCGLAAAFALALLARVGVGDFLRNLKVFAWLFILTIGIHLLFSPEASHYYRIPVIGLNISAPGLENGVFYSLRIALLLAFSYLLMAVTSPLEIADGIELALKPLKRIGIPSHEAAMVMSIALRFVPTLLDEARRIRDAQLCRGARLEGGILQRVKGFSAMLIPLFASALRRADNLALAMEARGYRGGENRTSYIELSFSLKDAAAVFITFITVIGLTRI